MMIPKKSRVSVPVGNMSSRKRNKIIEEFIELYKSEPCLWRIKSKDYHDRSKREAAYAKLVEKLKESEPDANKETVVKKINNLRSNVRKERKKYEASVKSGASADDIYQPTLWYYDCFDFLGDQETPRRSNSNIDVEESDCEENFVNNEESNIGEGSSQNVYSERTENEDQGPSQNAQQSSTAQKADKNTANQPNSSRPGKKKGDQLTTDVLLSVRDHFKRPPKQDDRYDLLGKSIALKLRGLKDHQRLVAEKRINDILFEAEMDSLSTQPFRNIAGCMQQYPETYSTYSPSPTFMSSPSPNSFSHTPSISPPHQYAHASLHPIQDSAVVQSTHIPYTTPMLPTATPTMLQQRLQTEGSPKNISIHSVEEQQLSIPEMTAKNYVSHYSDS